MVLAEPPARHAFEAVHERRHRHFRRVIHQQMHIIVLSAHLDQLCLEIGTDRGEDVPHIVKHRGSEHTSPDLRHKDQMDVN